MASTAPPSMPSMPCSHALQVRTRLALAHDGIRARPQGEGPRWEGYVTCHSPLQKIILSKRAPRIDSIQAYCYTIYMTKRLMLYLTESEHRGLRMRAARDGKSMQDLIRGAMVKGGLMEGESGPAAQKLLTPLGSEKPTAKEVGKTLGIITAEDLVGKLPGGRTPTPADVLAANKARRNQK